MKFTSAPRPNEISPSPLQPKTGPLLCVEPVTTLPDPPKPETTSPTPPNREELFKQTRRRMGSFMISFFKIHPQGDGPFPPTPSLTIERGRFFTRKLIVVALKITIRIYYTFFAF
jgi:hypothetical protein